MKNKLERNPIEAVKTKTRKLMSKEYPVYSTMVVNPPSWNLVKRMAWMKT